MSTPNRAYIEFGTAACNIAGNIDALLPQLASRGAEVAKAGNQIHTEIVALRQLGAGLKDTSSPVIQPVAFDKAAERIEAILPQLSGYGVEVDAIANAINGYCNQLNLVYAQHLHLLDENAPLVAGVGHVNNGIGTAPFETGTAVSIPAPDASGIDVRPTPAGTGD